MRNRIIIPLFLFLTQVLLAQDGNNVFGFLRYPTSARANALGGHTVSLVERDPSLIFHNPALLGGEMDGMVNINYMNYISDINMGSAVFTKAIKERAAWGVGISYVGYGDIKATDINNIAGGSLAASDINASGFFSYDLSDKWRGGMSMKLLYSVMGDYTSVGLGVDAGLSYYDSEKSFSFGFAFKNVGAQLKAYNDIRQKMPWDIQMGITKKIAHAPIRISLTAMYLNRWKFDYIDEANNTYKGDNFFKAFVKHFVIGVDFVPSDNFWVGIGFNPKTNMDMKLENGNGLGGFSGGAGVKIKMFDIGVSLAKYHPSALSMLLSVSTALPDFK